jgi:hypothetical protein
VSFVMVSCPIPYKVDHRRGVKSQAPGPNFSTDENINTKDLTL